MWRWGHPACRAPERGRGRQGEVHHRPDSFGGPLPVRHLALQRRQRHHHQQRRPRRGRLRRQDLAGPSHWVPGAQGAGAGGQRDVRRHHLTGRGAAEAGECHAGCVRWVLVTLWVLEHLHLFISFSLGDKGSFLLRYRIIHCIAFSYDYVYIFWCIYIS